MSILFFVLGIIFHILLLKAKLRLTHSSLNKKLVESWVRTPLKIMNLTYPNKRSEEMIRLALMPLPSPSDPIYFYSESKIKKNKSIENYKD